MEQSQGERERVEHRIRTIHHGEGIPWVALGERDSPPGVPLEEGILPLQGQRVHQKSLSGHSVAGAEASSEGRYPGLNFSLCITIESSHHALSTHFSGTGWCPACHKALLQRTEVNPSFAELLKIWSFES